MGVDSPVWLYNDEVIVAVIVTGDVNLVAILLRNFDASFLECLRDSRYPTGADRVGVGCIRAFVDRSSKVSDQSLNSSLRGMFGFSLSYRHVL